jgi:hypothetical protein
LIESFAQIGAIEADEIDDGLRGDASELSFFQVECKTRVTRKLALP